MSTIGFFSAMTLIQVSLFLIGSEVQGYNGGILVNCQLFMCNECFEDEICLKDPVNETGLANMFVAMKKLLLWQQMLTRVILLIDLL